MTKVKLQTIKYAVVLLIMFGGFFAYLESAAAQTFYPNYAPQSQQEFIAYLYGIIAQLQAQNGSTASFQSQTTFSPNGAVLGAANSFGSTRSSFDVEVFTSGANNIDGDEAWVFGSVDLNRAQFADVWFEYGETRSMNDRSRSGRITQRTSETFRGDLDGLREDETYFFRAVAQDPSGFRTYGQVRTFESDDDSRSRTSSRRNNDDDEPDAFTDDADDVDEDSAELNGEVDMNDFRNGLVFFAYGEDEDDVEDVEDEDEFNDIDERGDDLRLIVVDRDLDDDDNYSRRIGGLDDDTDYYFRICVEYEDEDDDETLECGDVEEFETDRD